MRRTDGVTCSKAWHGSAIAHHQVSGNGLEDSGSAEDQTMAFREKRERLLGSCMPRRKDV